MKIDLAKRRRVMQRSQKLGHCICDPRRSCPCDVFTDRGICPCAGERPDPAPADEIRLTQKVHNAGCASKISPADLEAVLSRLPKVDDPAVLSGVAAGDDAGIYALADGVTLVQTVDVFTPCVDDPCTFGRICVANCLSDIYAMGAVPRTALSILGFPSETLDGQIMYQMLKGAMDVLADAGVALIGGHSIKDDEIKLGFAVTGTIERGKVVEHGTAAVGDVLVLTKPLGVGVLNFARQAGRQGGDLAAAERSMATLNKDAAEAMGEVGVSACTDVTGFGLMGHLASMVRCSGVTARLYAESLPAFGGAVELLRDGVVPGAIERNREFVGDDLSVADGVDEARVDLAFDAQTSGGLLMAVAAERHAALLDALARRGVTGWTVGRIVAASNGKIEVIAMDEKTTGGQTPPEACCVGSGAGDGGGAQEAQPKQTHSPECCANVFASAPGGAGGAGAAGGECCAGSGDTSGQAAPAGAQSSPAAEGAADHAARGFGAMMRAVGAAGTLDERTKELLIFTLAVATRCTPCLTAHLSRARKMGISQAELDEAAWCAIAMGGAPVRMFYLEALKTAGNRDQGPANGRDQGPGTNG